MSTPDLPSEGEVFIEEEQIHFTSASPRSHRPTLSDLFTQAIEQFQALIEAEIALIKLKTSAMAKKAGIGGAMLAVAGLLGLVLLFWVFHTIEVALAIFLPAWAAALIVLGIILALLALFAIIGGLKLKSAGEDAPSADGIKADIDAVKEGLKK